jgi:EAL domain-containing protein (putative c-di-GMP-specific phosphodiesterase class I)
LSTPVQLSIPVSILPELQPSLLRLLSSYASEARNIELVLRHTDETPDLTWITLCAPLRALGVSIWLEHDVSVPSQQTLGLDILEGLRFCYPDDEQPLADHVQQTLLQACGLATEHGLKTIVGNVWNKARRDAAMRVGATYVQGEFLGSPMSRDGVLLGLASIESM